MARPRFEPTEEERILVKALASYGITQELICRKIKREIGGKLKPISIKTLAKYFPDELLEGEPDLIALVADCAAKMATDAKHPQQFQAIRFILKCRAGWRETDRVTHDGQVDFNLDLSGATDEELGVIEKFLKRRVSDAASPANDVKAA